MCKKLTIFPSADFFLSNKNAIKRVKTIQPKADL